VVGWLLDARPDTRHCRQMHHRAWPMFSEKSQHRIAIANVRFHQRELAVLEGITQIALLQRAGIKVTEDVHAHHTLAEGEQLIRQVRTDEPRCAGDQNGGCIGHGDELVCAMSEYQSADSFSQSSSCGAK